MLLAVDVGNTQTVVGLMDGGEIIEHWRLATVRHRTGDEIAGLLVGFLSLRDQRPREVIDEVAIASVVPRLTMQWTEMCERVNAVAGRERYGAPVVVVDFGTSTNFDVVNADGDYVGGAIAPGIEVSMEALTTRAAKLIKVDMAEPEHAIGKDTTEAMQAGAVYGFAGQVDGIVQAIWAELGTKARVVATGGLAELIAPHAKSISEVDLFLTLRGLELILRRQTAR
jgi:type III pantothenate kinase